MASKLAAARIASWSGVRAVIARAARPDVLADAVAGALGRRHHRSGPTTGGCRPASCGSPSPRGADGTVVVDDGARRALVERGTSLLPAGVLARARATFDEGDAVDVAGPDGRRLRPWAWSPSTPSRCGSVAGRRTADLPPDVRPEAIHRDDLVVLPGLTRRVAAPALSSADLAVARRRGGGGAAAADRRCWVDGSPRACGSGGQAQLRPVISERRAFASALAVASSISCIRDSTDDARCSSAAPLALA